METSNKTTVKNTEKIPNSINTLLTTDNRWRSRDHAGYLRLILVSGTLITIEAAIRQKSVTNLQKSDSLNQFRGEYRMTKEWIFLDGMGGGWGGGVG